MLENVHSQESFDDSVHIADKSKVEIVELNVAKTFYYFISLKCLIDIEF